MSGEAINFAAIAAAQTEAPAAPADNATAAEATQKADTVAAATVAVAETVAPGIDTVAPASQAESTVLGVEALAQKVMAEIPGISAFSGLVLPAEIVTHLGFAFFHLLRHHAATVNAQNAKGK